MAAPAVGSRVGAIWWARAVPEVPTSFTSTCARDGCDSEVEHPFDVYCAGPQPHFLLLADRPRLQVAAVYSARALFAALALLAASSASSIPLYVAAGIAGGALLYVALRAFPTSSLVGPLGWLLCFALATTVHERWISHAVEDNLLTAAAVVLAGSLMAAMLLRTTSADTPTDLARRGMALALSLALALSSVTLAFELGLGDVEGSVRAWLLVGAIVSVGSAAGAAVLVGLLRSVTRVDYNRPFLPPRRFEPPQLSRPSDPTRLDRSGRDALARLARAVLIASMRLANGVIDIANVVFRISWGAANAGVRGLAWLFHLLRLWIIRVALVLVAALTDALVTFTKAARDTGLTGRRWAESTLATLALLVLGAVAAVVACDVFASYLDGGPLLEGIATLVLAGTTCVALVAVWWPLTKRPAREIAESAKRTLEAAGASLFITLVVLGWVDGIVGMLGYGPIRPGWLTIGGTTILAGAVVISLATERGQTPGTQHQG